MEPKEFLRSARNQLSRSVASDFFSNGSSNFLPLLLGQLPKMLLLDFGHISLPSVTPPAYMIKKYRLGRPARTRVNLCIAYWLILACPTVAGYAKKVQTVVSNQVAPTQEALPDLTELDQRPRIVHLLLAIPLAIAGVPFAVW